MCTWSLNILKYTVNIKCNLSILFYIFILLFSFCILLACTSTYKYVYICVYVCVYMYVYMSVYICVHVAYRYTCAYMYMYVYMYLYISTDMYVWMYIYMYSIYTCFVNIFISGGELKNEASVVCTVHICIGGHR